MKLTELILPPGCSVRIDYNPDQRPTNVLVTAMRDGEWIGEVEAPADLVDSNDHLQVIVDGLTKRGVRPMREAKG